MKQILTNLKYHIYWDEENKIAYVRDNIKVRHINEIRLWLLCSGYVYKNLIIGSHYDGE